MKFANMITLSTILVFSNGLASTQVNATYVNADNVNAEENATPEQGVSCSHNLYQYFTVAC